MVAPDPTARRNKTAGRKHGQPFFFSAKAASEIEAIAKDHFCNQVIR
jgi:hypothetical protein